MKYKFRGKSDSGEWYYGSLIETRDQDYIVISDSIEWQPVIRKSVAMYTGIKDWNKKEIYSGDLVEVESVCPGGDDIVGKVEWIEGGWFIADRDKTKIISLFQEVDKITL